MPENIYPKVNGDIIYASELAPTFAGSVLSGTTLTTYSAGIFSGTTSTLFSAGVFSGTTATIYGQNLHNGLGSVRTVGTTAEGTFPKVDGDILYASEANKFGRSSTFIQAGSFAAVGSQTADVFAGSIVLIGSLSNPCLLRFNFTSSKADESNILVRISGPAETQKISFGSGLGTDTFGEVVMQIGSPMVGHIRGYGILNENTNSSTAQAKKMCVSATAVSDLNPGSVVILIGYLGNVGNSSYDSYSLHMDRTNIGTGTI